MKRVDKQEYLWNSIENTATFLFAIQIDFRYEWIFKYGKAMVD